MTRHGQHGHLMGVFHPVVPSFPAPRESGHTPAPAAELSFNARITCGSTDCTWKCLRMAETATCAGPGSPGSSYCVGATRVSCAKVASPEMCGSKFLPSTPIGDLLPVPSCGHGNKQKSCSPGTLHPIDSVGDLWQRPDLSEGAKSNSLRNYKPVRSIIYLSPSLCHL